MEFSNKNRIRKTRGIVNFIAAFLSLLILFFSWREMAVAAITAGIVLVLLLLALQTLNLNYFYYSSSGVKLVIRFYPAITFFPGMRNYQVIEFDRRALYRFELRKDFIFSKLYLEVHTGSGIAGYPEIGLQGVSEPEIEQIRADLSVVVNQND